MTAARTGNLFFSEVLRISFFEPVYCAHGRIINFYFFWRRNARSHTKYPKLDKNSIPAYCWGGGWLRGSGSAGWDFRVGYLVWAAKGVRLGRAGVGIATCIYFKTITDGSCGAFGWRLGSALGAFGSGGATLGEAVPLTCTV